MAIRRGTQTLGRPNVVPGAIILDNDTSNLTNTGRGTPSIVPAKKRQSQQWAVTDAGVTNNNGGHGITVLDVSTVNSAFQGLAYTFPNDGTTDDNSWTIDVALPDFMSSTPNMVFRLFVQATGTGRCGGGGTEVFTGAKLASPGTQSIPDSSQIGVTFGGATFDTGTYFDIAHPSRLTIPTGLDGTFFLEAGVWAAGAASGFAFLVIVDQDGNEVASDMKNLVPTIGTFYECRTLVTAVAGNWFELQFWQNSGGPLNLTNWNSNRSYYNIGRWDKPA